MNDTLIAQVKQHELNYKAKARKHPKGSYLRKFHNRHASTMKRIRKALEKSKEEVE